MTNPIPPNESGPVEGPQAGRDRAGRFVPGCKGGPGNPRLRALAAAQEAVRGAFTGADVVRVLAVLHDQALKGDAAAATAFLQRVLGRPREEPAEATIELPPLDSIANIEAALAKITSAVADGEIEATEATALANLVERVAEAGVLQRLAQRVDALEARR